MDEAVRAGGRRRRRLPRDQARHRRRPGRRRRDHPGAAAPAGDPRRRRDLGLEPLRPAAIRDDQRPGTPCPSRASRGCTSTTWPRSPRTSRPAGWRPRPTPTTGPVAGACTAVNVAAGPATVRDYYETVTGALGVEPVWDDARRGPAGSWPAAPAGWGWTPTVDLATALAEIDAGLPALGRKGQVATSQGEQRGRAEAEGRPRSAPAAVRPSPPRRVPWAVGERGEVLHPGRQVEAGAEHRSHDERHEQQGPAGRDRPARQRGRRRRPRRRRRPGSPGSWAMPAQTSSRTWVAVPPSTCPAASPMLTANSTTSTMPPASAFTTCAPQPARPGDAGGQHRLQRPAGLVDPHAQQHLDQVDGDEHAGHLDDRDAVGVDDLVGAARLGPPVAGAALDVLDLLGEAAEDQAEHGQADRPAENAPRWSRHTSPTGLSSGRAAVAWPRRSGHSPGRRRGATQRDAVATSRQPKAATASTSGHQWLPPKGRVCWPQPIGESQAGQALVTREPGPVDGAEHVADAAERERDAEDASGDAGGAARGGRQLAGHRGDADPDERPPRPPRRRPAGSPRRAAR